MFLIPRLFICHEIKHYLFSLAAEPLLKIKYLIYAISHCMNRIIFLLSSAYRVKQITDICRDDETIKLIHISLLFYHISK